MNWAIENKILNDKEISERKYILKSRPRRLIVTLTTKCNAKCIMCEVRESKWDIPKRVISEIIELFPYLESIAWQGGEVFFLEEFEEIFNEALKFKNMKQTIVTNGLLLNDKWIEKILKANMELAISIDGVTKGVYEKIRQGSKFDLLFLNLNRLNKARKRSNSQFRLRLHTVVMKSNYKQIGRFIEMAKEYNFNALHFMPIYGNQNSDENIFLYKDENIFNYLINKIKLVEKKARKYKIEFLNSLPLNYNKNKEENKKRETANSDKQDWAEELLCYLPWQQLNIDPGGEVRPGCLCFHPVGSVLKNSLKEIWNSEYMQQYRKMILLKNGNWCNRACLEGKVPMELRKF